MQIHLVAVGNKMPSWVEQGFAEYAKRLPAECALRLIEIPPGKRGKHGDIKRAIKEEGERMLAAVPKNTLIIALVIEGRQWSTPQLARQLEGWLAGGRDVALLIGGADGLSTTCLESAQETWSLSALTFPHPLVRVVLAEQLYRACSILKQHPYHRE